MLEMHRKECSTCMSVGLVEEVDGHPIRFVKTVPCPVRCDFSLSKRSYFRAEDMVWRQVSQDDPIHSCSDATSRFVPIVNRRPKPAAMEWMKLYGVSA